PYAPDPAALDHTAPPPPAASPVALPEGDADAPGVVIDVTRPEPPPRPAPVKKLKACTGCRSTLPPGRDVRFCPFCGKCLAPIPCPECSAVVEPEWRFCVTCGWPRDGQPLSPPPEQRLR
ncbi:MAG: zinc ribbon domain-containing protein, partial [Longimicrobiaceae bacterium]